MQENRVHLVNPTAGKGVMILGRLEQIVGIGLTGLGGMNFLASNGYSQESAKNLMIFGIANIVVGQGVYWVGKIKHWYYN